MKIKRGNREIADVYAKNTSYTNEEINGQHIAYVEFDSLEPVELTVNDSIEYNSNTYYIRYKENVRKVETSRGYSYQVTFYHELYRLHDVVFSLYDEIEFKKHTSTYIGTADEVLKLIVKSMNRISPGWIQGACVETKPQTFNFKDKTCAEVINDLINAYHLEYWVEGRTICLGKREYDSNGLVLQQGEGFRNLALQAVDDTPPITRLYAYGSDTNLTTEYGDYLLLPGGRKYIEKNIDKYGVIEYTKQFENIFPKGEFYISERIDNLTFFSEKLFNLKDYLIDGVEPIITFQDGPLAGYDLAINAGKSDFASKTIVLMENKEENALTIPGNINFEVGNMFIITGIKMPGEYIESASQELLVEAQKWLDEKCENRVQLKGDCDEIDFAERKISIGCGQMVKVFDQKLGINREIRTTAVKHYIEEDAKTPYRYEIILSDFLQTNGFGQIVNEIKEIPNKIDKEVKPVYEYSRRRWRDTVELSGALQEAFTNFSEGINPVFVRTMQLVAGDERLQFRFVDSRIMPKEIGHVFRYIDGTRIFSTNTGIIQHMTLGVDTFAPDHNSNEYKFWDVSEYSYKVPDTSAYWLYVKCSKSNTRASFLLSKTVIEMDSDASYYHFIAGYLNSEYEGSRSFVPLYGFTEILPGQVRVNKVISTDGTQYFDMLGKKFKIGDNDSCLSYNVDAPNQLILKGTMVQSSSGGAIDYLEIDRGNWVSNTTYSPGDKVKYSDGNIYKCIKENKGELPTNTTYWKLLVTKGDKGDTGQTGASGNDGKPGQGYKYAYFASNSVTLPTKPSTPGVIPSTWMDSPNFKGCRYIYVSQCTYINGTWSVWTDSVVYSVMPKDGDTGPSIVFRGWYIDPKDNSKTLKGQLMYNNAVRRDVVKATWDGGETVYYSIYSGPDATPLPGTWDDDMWDAFGTQFESIATNLLLAENANVGGWFFQNERLESQSGGAYLDGKTGEVSITGTFKSANDGNLVEISNSRKLMLMSENRTVGELKFFVDQEYVTSTLSLTVFSGNTPWYSLDLNPRRGLEFIDLNTGGYTTFGMGGIVFDLDKLPSDSRYLYPGVVYRDGNTLKIKT